MRSQEKSRTLLEILVFVLCVLSVGLVIWQFAQTSLETFEPGIAPCIVCHASGPKPQTRS